MQDVDVADIIRALNRCLSDEGHEKCLFIRPDFVVVPLRQDTTMTAANHISKAMHSHTVPLHVTWVLGATTPGLLPQFLSDLLGLPHNSDSSEVLCVTVQVLQMLTSPVIGGQTDGVLAPRMVLRIDATEEGDVLLRCTAMPLQEHAARGGATSLQGAVDKFPISSLYLSAKTLCDTDVEYGTFLKSLEAIHILKTAKFYFDGQSWVPKSDEDTEAFSRLCNILGQSSASVLASAYQDPPHSALEIIGTPLLRFLVDWLMDRCNVRLARFLAQRQQKEGRGRRGHAQAYTIVHCCNYGEDIAIQAASATLGIPLVGQLLGHQRNLPDIIADVANTCDLVVQLLNVDRLSQWRSDLTQSLVVRCVSLEMQRPNRVMHTSETLALFGSLLRFLPAVMDRSDGEKVGAICAHFLPQGSYIVDLRSSSISLSRQAIATLRMAASRAAMAPSVSTPQKRSQEAGRPTSNAQPSASGGTPQRQSLSPASRHIIGATPGSHQKKPSNNTRLRTEDEIRLVHSAQKIMSPKKTPVRVRYEDVVVLNRSSILRAHRSHADPMLPTTGRGARPGGGTGIPSAPLSTNGVTPKMIAEVRKGPVFSARGKRSQENGTSRTHPKASSSRTHPKASSPQREPFSIDEWKRMVRSGLAL